MTTLSPTQNESSRRVPRDLAQCMRGWANVLNLRRLHTRCFGRT